MGRPRGEPVEVLEAAAPAAHVTGMEDEIGAAPEDEVLHVGVRLAVRVAGPIKSRG